MRERERERETFFGLHTIERCIAKRQSPIHVDGNAHVHKHMNAHIQLYNQELDLVSPTPRTMILSERTLVHLRPYACIFVGFLSGLGSTYIVAS